MDKLICPACHNADHRPGAKFCWVCGYGFPLSRGRDEPYVLEKAIETFGHEHIAEEIADVEIVLEQLMMMFQCKDEVRKTRAEKVERLWGRICKAKGEADETGNEAQEGDGGRRPEHPACEAGECLPDDAALFGGMEKGQGRSTKAAQRRRQILVTGKKGRWSER